MDVKLTSGQIDINWKPRSFNRFLRFVRYLKFKEEAYQSHLNSLKFRNDQAQLHKQKQSLQQRPSIIIKSPHSFSQESALMDCSTQKHVLMSVKADINQLNIVCIHPNNDSYPIFTIQLTKKQLEFKGMFDHDEILLKMGNMSICDNSRYPKTLDPVHIYTSKIPIESQPILSGKKIEQGANYNMMELKMIIPHFPMERTCFIARKEEFKQFDKMVKIDLKSMNLVFLMEYLFRMQDYFFTQLIGAASDSNPYAQIAAKASEKFQVEKLPSKKLSYKNQYPLTTGLDICISHPVIILKDRTYLKRGKVKIDFGDIKIDSDTQKQTGRWHKKPTKGMLVTTLRIKGHGFTMSYTQPTQMKFKSNTDCFTILPVTDFTVSLEKLNYSQLLEQQFLSENIDFEDLDNSQHLNIQFSSFKLQMTQEVYTYFLRCNDLNLNYSDQLVKHFQLAIWNDQNTMKFLKMEADTTERYAGNTLVCKQKMVIKFPSFSFSLLNIDHDHSMIAELVFWNFQVVINRYLDKRSDIKLKAHSLQILSLSNQNFDLKKHSAQQDRSNCKALIMGHTSAHNFLVTDQDYYNFNFDRIIQATKASSVTQERKRRTMLEKSNFEVQITMMPSSEKLIKCKLTQPKIFMRADIFMMIAEFFNTAHPSYAQETFDKPNFYSSDPNILPRQEIWLEMEEGLICFENEEDSNQTLVCSCSLIVNKVRETLDTVKLSLLDRLHRNADSTANLLSLTDQDFDHSAKIGLMLVSLTQFSPYFCEKVDLDGTPFRLVKKRELMSPFNMHYNVYEMIELNQKTQILSNYVRNLVFRTYKKTDASIDWTLLKITFQDIAILRQIADHIGKLVNENFMEWQKRRLQNYDSQSEDSDYSPSSDEEQVRVQLSKPFSKITEKSSFDEDSQDLNSDLSNSEESKSDESDSEQSQQFQNSGQNNKQESRRPRKPDQGLTSLLNQNSIVDTIRFIQQKTTQISAQEPKKRRSNVIERAAGLSNQNPFYFQVTNQQDQKTVNQHSLFIDDVVEEESKRSLQSKSFNSKRSSDSFDISSTEMAEEVQDIQNKNRVMAQKVTKTLSQHSDSQLFDASSINQDSQGNGSIANGLDNSILVDRVKLRAVPREDIKKYSDKDLTKVIYQEQGHDSMQVVSYGVQLLLINDNKDNFLPVFGVQLSEFLYSNGLKNSIQVGKTQISLQFSYYNALAGSWEPALENSSMSLNLMAYKNGQKDISVHLEKEININISESLLKTIHDTSKSLKQNEAAPEINKQFRSQKQIKVSKGLTQGHLIDFSEVERDTGTGKLVSESSEIIVSPYAIHNLTETDIIIEKEVTQIQYQKMLKKMQKRETARRETVNNQVSDSAASLLQSDLSLKRAGTSMRPTTVIKSPLPTEARQNSFGNNVQANSKELINLAVLKVAPGQTSNYAVDYEKVIKQQIDLYRELNHQTEEIINVSFGRKSKVPITGINLNKTGRANKHYFPNSKFKEFVLYAVSFKHLKRVLTVRTQYLLHNQTLESYTIRIINLFDKQYFQEKTLNSGDLLPIPESYNQSIIQLKLSSDDDQNWSDEWHVYALKHIVKPNCPGHLKHGKTYTFFRKVETEHPQTYNINLMPPLVLKNCLPCPIFFQFVDSNNVLCKLTLEKEEVKNIFQFDLQREIKLQISIPAYNSSVLRLDNTVELLEEQRDKIVLTDYENHKVQIFYTKSSKSAGFTLSFFVTNCIINQTDQNMNFFYERPSREFDLTQQDQTNQVSIPYDILRNSANESQSIDKLYLLSPTREVWAKIESGADISPEINTFTPGTNEKFQLVKKNRIYEYGYSTEVYLANKLDFIYTKITTISPLYVVVNYTKSTLLFAQLAARNVPMFVKPNQHLPFHWSDREAEKLVSVRVIPSKNDRDYSEDFDWSSGITLLECGSLIVCNRQITERMSLVRGTSVQSSAFGTNKYLSSRVSFQSESQNVQALRPKKRFLRINRKYHRHQIYVIIEEEDPELPNMLIENLCSNTSIVCQQVGNSNMSDVDVIDPRNSEPFSWTDHKGLKQLQIKFFEGSFHDLASVRYPIENGIKQISKDIVLDEINFEKREIVFFKDSLELMSQERVFYTVTTNGYTKILRFDNKPPVLVKNKIQEEKSEIVSTSSGPDQLTKFDLVVPQINFSLLTKGCELLTMYMKGIHVLVESDKMRTKLNFNLKEFQIDNQSEFDPIYPVMLRAKKEGAVRTQPGLAVQTQLPQDLFQLTIDMRKDVENVQYFDLVQFLLQHLELKLELSHLVLLAEFGSRVGKMFKRNINKQHKVFQSAPDEVQHQTSQNPSLIEEAKQEEREQDYLDRQRLVAKNRKMSIAILKRQNTINLTQKSSQISKKQEKTTKIGARQPTKSKSNEQEESLAAQPSIQNRVYIKEYIGSPLKITISLIKHGITLNDESNELTLFKTISSLGLSISTFENAPIILNALKIKNIFGDQEEVTEQLKGYYLQTIKWNTLSFLGASNLIGNPISLINTLGTGVEEFFYEPYQGFMRGGAAEGALGIVSGTGSLFKNTSLGLVGSLGKIGSSISAGILSITGDEEFIQRRNMGMIRYKPRGVMQGLEQGISSALQSGWSGLKGVVDKPNEGFMKSGAQGFFKGALQGAAGLFVKPITGAMDLVVKTSEGIENSSKSHLEFQSDERIRQPRAFYEAEKIIRDYDLIHAKILSITPHLQFYSPDSDRNAQLFQHIDTSIFYGAWILEESSDGYWHILMLVKDQIVRIKRFANQESLLEEQKSNDRLKKQGKSLIQVVSLYKVSELKQIELYERMLDLEFEDGREILEIMDDRTASLVCQKIKSLHKENLKAKRLKQMQQLQNFSAPIRTANSESSSFISKK